MESPLHILAYSRKVELVRRALHLELERTTAQIRHQTRESVKKSRELLRRTQDLPGMGGQGSRNSSASDPANAPPVEGPTSET